MLGPVDEEGGKEGPKANKGMILRKSVDYIKCVPVVSCPVSDSNRMSRYLQQLVRAQASRNRELESQLSQYRGPDAAASDATASLGLDGLSGVDGGISAVDLGGLLTIPDGDGDDAEMSLSGTFNSEISSQILATLEANQDHAPTMSSIAGESPSVDGMDEEDEDASISIGDESERGRQAMRRGRFGAYPSQSVGKSAKVEEVDES